MNIDDEMKSCCEMLLGSKRSNTDASSLLAKIFMNSISSNNGKMFLCLSKKRKKDEVKSSLYQQNSIYSMEVPRQEKRKDDNKL